MNWLRKCKQSFRDKPVDFMILLGLTPDVSKYPYQRRLYYVYKNSNYNNGVKAFLSYATSPQGQQVLVLGNLDASPQE